MVFMVSFIFPILPTAHCLIPIPMVSFLFPLQLMVLFTFPILPTAHGLIPIPYSPAAPVSAILLEYPVYGNFLSFLVCKRLGRISNNSKGWGGLDYWPLEERVLKALPDENRQYLSSLLDGMNVRSRPYKAALNVGFSDLDLWLFAVQIANGMQFLNESGVSHFQYISLK